MDSSHAAAEAVAEPGAAPAAEAVAVSKRFGATRAVERVSIAIGRGESRALVGRNGAGKSTLVSILTGLVRADDGEVYFAGRPAPRPADRQGWQRCVACVYQHSTLLPQLTVAENLFLNAQPRGGLGLIDWKLLRRRAQDLLDEWGIAVPAVAEASGLKVEERQQVEIARALASGSRFLILDEPTARLEAGAIRRLFGHITRLRAGGVSVLYISHHLDEIYEICDTVSVLRDGRLVHSGDVSSLPKQQLIAAMIGDSTRDGPALGHARGRQERSSPVHATQDQALHVEGLSVDGWCSAISFDVQPGELVGLAGLAGSGKAQVAQAIVGLRKPSTGSVRLGDRQIPPGDVHTTITHGIGYVPQDRRAEGFAPNLSIEENLTLSVMGRLGRFGLISPSRRRSLAQQLMGSLEVVASGSDQPVAELSGGNQQKVVVGRALVTHPRALVVLSPTAGVDVASKETLFERLTSLSDVAVLVVSDELDELVHCDRVLVMFNGRITTEFETWNEHELVAAMEGVQAHEH